MQKGRDDCKLYECSDGKTNHETKHQNTLRVEWFGH